MSRFDELESELSARPFPAPSDDLRQRILSAMHAEALRPLAAKTGQNWWHYAAAAAAVLLAINFSMSVANDADFCLAAKTDRASLAVTAAELRGLAPELSEDEAMRQALVLKAGAGAVASPSIHFPEMEPK